jgi:hypothetical protein
MFRLPQRGQHQAEHQNCKQEIVYVTFCGRFSALQMLLRI